jgi:hypothetical protein
MNDELPDNLARMLQALDADAARAASRLDPARMAHGVLERLRTEPVAPDVPARRWTGGARHIAAAAIVLLIGGVIVQRLAITPAGGGVTVFTGLPVSLSADSMDAGQASDLLAAVEQARAVPAGGTDSATTAAHTVSVDDLNETELRTLLRIMESSEETK